MCAQSKELNVVLLVRKAFFGNFLPLVLPLRLPISHNIRLKFLEIKKRKEKKKERKKC